MDQLVDLFAKYGLFIGLPLLFLLIVAWIYRPSAKKRFEADGNLPFYGDKKVDKAGPDGR